MNRRGYTVAILCAAVWLLTATPWLTASPNAQTCVDYHLRCQWVGTQPSDGLARGVAAGDQMFAILEGEEGLELFQLVPDESPTFLAWIAATDSTFAAEFSDQTLFVADGPRIVAYDLSIPTSPSPVDTLTLGQRILSLAGQGGTLAACCGTDGLVFVDASDPANMALAATVPIGGPGALDLARDNLELVVGAGDSLLTVDGANPYAPLVLARIALPGRANQVTRNQILACAAGDSNGMAVIDLADPANPTATVHRSLARPRQLLLANGALITTGSGLLRYYQVPSAHATPLYYGYSALPGRALTGASAPGQGLAVMGEVLLVAGGAAGGQGFMLAGNVPVVPVGPAYNLGMNASDLAIGGSLAIVALNAASETRILDVSNPLSPAELASRLPAAATVAARDELAYVIAADGTLTIHDLSMPESPQLLSSTDLGVMPLRCALAGSWLYVTALGGGLLPVDVSDPGAPAPAPLFSTLGDGLDLTVAGGIAYLVDGAGRLETISVANPAAPVALGSVNTGGDALGVCAFNGRAYVADGVGGLTQLDVHDPAHPTVVDNLPVSESATAIASAAGILYIGETGVGLMLADARDQYGDFYFSGQLFNIMPPVARVRVAGDYVYVLTSNGYLSIGSRSCDTTTPAFLARFTADLEGDAAVLRWETSAADGEFRLTARAGGAEREVPWTRVDERRCEARDTAVRRLPGATVAYTLRWRGDGGDWEELASRSVEIPAARTALHDPYPNPFNPRVTVAFTLDRAQHARLAVHDARGRLVAVLADGVQPAGRTELVWDGRDGRGRAVAADTYFLRLEAESARETRRLTLVR